jgi:putative ABC transport system permease protein
VVRREIQRAYLVPIAIGVSVGVVGAFLLTRTMASLLYEVQPTDPLTFVGVVAILGSVGWVASFIPSLRSSRADPLETMRAE